MSEKELMVMRQQPAMFVPLKEFEKPGMVSGLILPDGTKMMEMRGISGMAFSLYQKQLGATPFNIKGKWLFIPDEETIMIFGDPNAQA